VNIGIVIGRIGGVDGVALETEKWIIVLERMGHQCHIITGRLEADVPNTTVVPELYFFHPDVDREQDDAFFKQDADEAGLLQRLDTQAQNLERAILDWIEKKAIDVLLSENSSAIPCHLAMGLAVKRVIEKSGIPAVAHNHDFYWERGKRYQTRYDGVRTVMEKCFPPVLENLNQAVINLFGQETLKREKGIDSIVVPNVMDFCEPFAQKDEYNRDLPKDLGLADDEIPLFQVTRIVRRKGIEVAIDLVRRLANPKVKLFITGTARDDPKQEYYNELVKQVEDLDLGRKVFFVADRVQNVRGRTADGGKIYSLSDAYAYARAMTYFSTYEGFGNAYVEAVLARVPIFVNNYKPVYWPDFGSLGFKTVQLEDNDLTDEAVGKIREIMYNPTLAAEIGDYNFELGKQHFSFEVLQEKLERLFSF